MADISFLFPEEVCHQLFVQHEALVMEQWNTVS